MAVHDRGGGFVAKGITPIPCPCCGTSMASAGFDILVDVYRLTPFETNILRAIWRGRGHPVGLERIFEAMFGHDPDGSPTSDRAYLSFKVSLCHIRKKLAGSGVSIETVGYRQGYRLLIGKPGPVSGEAKRLRAKSERSKSGRRPKPNTTQEATADAR